MINNTIFIVIITSFFLHIVDDFYLQEILMSIKQKEWWEEHYNDKLYQHDYIVALLIHSMSWSFMVHLPTLIYLYLNNQNLNFFCFSLIWQSLCHALVDHVKANRHTINLITDQILHVGQIIIVLITNLVL